MDAGDVLRAMAEEKDPRSLLYELAVPSSHPQLDFHLAGERAIWKNCNENVLSIPEVGLLSWVQCAKPSPPLRRLGRRRKSGSVQQLNDLAELVRKDKDSSC